MARGTRVVRRRHPAKEAVWTGLRTPAGLGDCEGSCAEGGCRMQEGEKSHASRGRILLRRKQTRALYCNSVAPCVFWKTHSWDVRRCSPGPQVSPRTTVKVEDPSDGEEGSRDCATLGSGGFASLLVGKPTEPPRGWEEANNPMREAFEPGVGQKLLHGHGHVRPWASSS